MQRVDLIVMNGLGGDGAVERMVGDARRAITLDLVQKATMTGAFASVVVSTNDPVLAEQVNGWPHVIVEMDPEEEAFHFGRRLRSLVAKHGMERVVYLGGGAAPLLTEATLQDMARQLREADRLFIANNFHSTDLCGLTPASVLLAVEPPENDNSLGWLLSQEGKLPARELPRTPATVFDVDTAIDLAILSLHPGVPPHTRAYLDSLALDTRHIEAASRVFVERGAQVLVAGRVSSTTMAYLERETACRTRVFSEERGMRSDGRLARGEARSLLAMHMESVGVERFFGEVIPQLGQAAFIDDRVIWAHRRLWPSANDRFSSDLLRPEEIADPWVRRFTEAAISCPVPVVLGGHSLVTGGLYVLVEAAWARSGVELQRLVEVT